MTVLVETRADFTLETARRVAWNGEGVELGAKALAAMQQGRQRLERILDHDPEVTIYGVTTGVGHYARKKLSSEEREQWANLSMARIAASWGDPLPERVVRAIVLARLTNFVEGHAAISPEIAQAVAAMLAEDGLPAVPVQGQGGAGEILSLSHLFAGLAERMKPAAKDVLCLINGSPSATGLVTDAALAADRRFDLAAQIFALSFEAFNAPLSHLDIALEDYWNNPHDGWALRRLRELVGRRPRRKTASLSGSRELSHCAADVGPGPTRSDHGRRGRRGVAPGGDGQPGVMAVAPIWYGPTLSTKTIPSVVSDRNALSTGGYHNPHAAAHRLVLGRLPDGDPLQRAAAPAMDALTARQHGRPRAQPVVGLACANLCVLAERHGAKLLDGRVSLLPDQLNSPEAGGDGRRAYQCRTPGLFADGPDRIRGGSPSLRPSHAAP